MLHFESLAMEHVVLRLLNDRANHVEPLGGIHGVLNLTCDNSFQLMRFRSE